jgi:hypothetical protein
LGQQLFQGIATALLRLYDEAAAFYRDADLGPWLQVQDIQQGSGDGQHYGAADFAEIRSVHTIDDFLGTYALMVWRGVLLILEVIIILRLSACLRMAVPWRR